MKVVNGGWVGSLPPAMVGEHFHRYGIVGQSRADRRCDPAHRAGVGDPQHGVDHGRNRHRQGAGGPRRAQSQRAAGHAVHQGQLRGHSRDPAGIGALRPCQRGVHGRHQHQERQVLPGQPRLDLSRRDRHDERRDCRPSCCASCRNAKSSRSARNGPSTWTFA